MLKQHFLCSVLSLCDISWTTRFELLLHNLKSYKIDTKCLIALHNNILLKVHPSKKQENPLQNPIEKEIKSQLVCDLFYWWGVIPIECPRHTTKSNFIMVLTVNVNGL